MAVMMIKLCELCGAVAEIHCAADSAFLCRSCDDNIHGANFLVARHIRHLICTTCGSVSDNSFSGAISLQFLPKHHLCSSCSSLSSSSPSSSSPDRDQSSSTSAGDKTTIITRKQRKKRTERTKGEAEGILVNWCRKMELNNGNGYREHDVVSSACCAFCKCFAKLPFRVSLAASFWYGIRVSGNRPASATWMNLRRVEGLSGVPCKLILAVESRLARGMRLVRPRVDLEEGWAESESA